MVRLINALTGSEMWVHETRVAEYLARGHRVPDKPAEAVEPAVSAVRERNALPADTAGNAVSNSDTGTRKKPTRKKD